MSKQRKGTSRQSTVTKRSKPFDLKDAPPIESLQDLINIGNSLEMYRNIDSVMSWRITPYLEELESLIGMNALKESILYQLIYYLQSLHLRNKDGEYLHTVIIGGPGRGKCLARGTPILQFDGSVVLAENVKIGDILMGDDSTPRTVQSICTGQETMYAIEQLYGDDYVVNESHILSLKLSKSPNLKHTSSSKRYRVRWFDKFGHHCKVFTSEIAEIKAKQFIQDLPPKGTVIDIPIKDYIKMSKSWKNAFKGYKTAVEFRDQELDLDPYILGYWLGHGTKNKPQITTVDKVVVKYFIEYFHELYVIPNKTGITYDITSKRSEGIMKDHNRMISSLRKYGVWNNKHIPQEYLVNSREKRLSLLAGILDSHGKLTSEGIFCIVQKNVQLSQDIMFLARSLGFRVTTTFPAKYSMYNGQKRREIYQRLCISGDLNQIPSKITKNQAQPIKINKDPLVYGIEVHKREVDTYYGFEIDGNHRFVLGDFTVTHNTTVARIIGKLYQAMGVLSPRGTFRIATRDDFVAGYLGQTAERTKKLLNSCIGGVLFIDEVYALGPGVEDKDSFSKEAIDTITGFLSEHAHDFCCIVAGYSQEVRKCFFAVNPGLKSRFPWVHEIEDYTPDELTEMIIKMIHDIKWEVNAKPSEITALIVTNKHIFEDAGRDVLTLISKCKMVHAKRVISLSPEEKFILTIEDLKSGIELAGKHRTSENVDGSTYMHMYM
jgi:hypothetical protein